MIKFFRKIRKKFLEQGKTSKYLSYALGEIILVVIGILIALQINNWNENRKNQNKIVGYLYNLTDDLSTDIKEFNQNIWYYERDIRKSEYVLSSDDYKKLKVDSILKLTTNIYNIDKTTRQTYEKIKNEGLIESLGSERINKAINNYYNLDISYYQNILNWDKEFTNKSYDFWFFNKAYEASAVRNNETNALPFLTPEENRKTDLISLIESIEGRNHIRGGLDRRKHLLKRVKETKKAAEDLIRMIQSELEKNDKIL